MKYMKRANIYKNSTGTNKFLIKELKAYSYDWWLYFTKLDNGITILNNTFYSSSTVKHQRDLKYLLYNLNINPDIIIQDSKNSLNKLPQVRKDLRIKVKELIEDIKKPRSRKSTNEKRLEKIKELRKQHSALIGRSVV